ncbi:MAG: SRPBCC family protein [Verrucomicrobia bacterium]|nr:SRPBCC family protein [Verrucomicrobiota bacterium]
MAHTYRPFAETDALDDLSRDLHRELTSQERGWSLATGGTLLALALSRSFRWAFLPAAVLLYRGLSGRRLPKVSAESPKTEAEIRKALGESGIKVMRSLRLDCPRDVVYRFWRKLDNLPRFLPHLEEVTVLSGTRSRWTLRGVAGLKFTWEAEIINEQENVLIAWQSLPGGEVSNAGSVRFEDDGRGGTLVFVTLEFVPPAGAAGNAIASLLGQAPAQQLERDLKELEHTFGETVEALGKEAAPAALEGSRA